jgi:hypothetical protein
MTNNKIPIENKKPVETVYELKNEYPSFEEFKKTYEENKEIISSYENELRAGGELNGYGPCKNSLCGCTCSSRKCVCEGDSVYVEGSGSSLTVSGRK